MNQNRHAETVESVRQQYAVAANAGLSSLHEGVRSVAEAFGYSREELESIPAEANLGLSCGNPTAMASLRAGETVLDLGCGGGLDVLLAAQRIAPHGRAIGVDMTRELLELAQRNWERVRPTMGQDVTVEFLLGTIDALPVADQTVDCVISNCVINLAPDKPRVFREIARVLKPGGRVAISDIALKHPLPDDLAADISAYVGCIAGAILMEDYRRGLEEAGFEQVDVIDTHADLNAYALVEGQAGCCSPPSLANGCCEPSDSAPLTIGLSPSPFAMLETPASSCCGGASSAEDDPGLHARLADLLSRYDVNHYAASVKVFAIKAS